jgi:hypothetical protein
MPHLTERQVHIREQLITDLAKMSSRGECPCCHRTFEIGKDRAEQIATEQNRALNALVAALYPEEPI